MKIIKRIVLIFFIILFLLIGIIIAIPFVFKDKLIELAKEEINNSINAKVDFGEFDLSVFNSFPDLNFQINNVEAIGLDDFEGDTLIFLEKLTADVYIMSVFGDNIKVNTIILDHPLIRAKVLEGGIANWDIAPSETDSLAVEDTVAEEPMEFALNLEEFRIIGGDIIYDDEDMDLYAEIKNLNFDLEGDMTMDFTSLITKTTIDQITVISEKVKYLNKTNIEINADLDADLVAYKFTFKENTVRLNQLELGFDGWIAVPDEDIDLDITFNTKKTDFKSILSLVPAVFLNGFESVKTSGKLALDGMAKGTYNDNSLPAFNLNLLVENAMFKYPDLPGSAENINIDLNVMNNDGIEDHTIINLKKFHIDFAKNPIDAMLLVKTPVSDPDLDAKIKGVINLDNMKDIVPLDDMTLNGVITMDVKMKGKMSMIDNEQYEAFDALGNIKIDNLNYKSEDIPQALLISHADMDVAPQFFNLNAFDATLGNSDLHLDGRIENFLAYTFRDELIKGEFNFSSRKFDANQLLSDDAGTESGTSEVSAEEDVEMTVFEVPENVDFVLNSQIGILLYDNMNIENISGTINVKEGRVDLQNLGMNLLDGQMVINGAYDTRNIAKPAIGFDMNITNFDIPKTFKTFNTVQKLASIAEHCEGAVSLNISQFDCVLLPNMDPDLSSIEAAGRLTTKNIKITNTKTLDKISDALKIDVFKNMNLTDLNLSFEIRDGKIEVKPFTTKIKTIEATISGYQGIDQTLDFVMKLSVPRKLFGSKANSVLNNLVSEAGKKGLDVNLSENVDVDVFITGTVSDPKIRLSLKDQAKNMIEDLKDQVVDKVKEEVDKAKQAAIKKAEAQAAKILATADQQGNALIKQAESKANQAKAAAKKAADKLKDEAYKQAKKVEDAANGKPKIMKTAAKKSADKIRQEADKKHKQAVNEANKQANKIITEAKKQKTNLINKAKAEGDKLILKAKNS